MADGLTFNPITIATLLAAAAGLATALLSLWKVKAEAESAATTAYLSLVKPLKDEMKELRDRIEQLETENAELHRGIQVLISQLYDMGHVPRWEPEKAEE